MFRDVKQGPDDQYYIPETICSVLNTRNNIFSNQYQGQGVQ